MRFPRFPLIDDGLTGGADQARESSLADVEVSAQRFELNVMKTPRRAIPSRLGSSTGGGLLSSTQRLSRRCQKLRLDASIYQDYLDQVAALIPGATRRRFRAPSGKEWEQLATSDSPNKGNPPLATLVTHGPEWFEIIDATVRTISAALENRDDSAE